MYLTSMRNAIYTGPFDIRATAGCSITINCPLSTVNCTSCRLGFPIAKPNTQSFGLLGFVTSTQPTMETASALALLISEQPQVAV